MTAVGVCGVPVAWLVVFRVGVCGLDVEVGDAGCWLVGPLSISDVVRGEVDKDGSGVVIEF